MAYTLLPEAAIGARGAFTIYAYRGCSIGATSIAVTRAIVKIIPNSFSVPF
jgi:hypothetical protein